MVFGQNQGKTRTESKLSPKCYYPRRPLLSGGKSQRKIPPKMGSSPLAFDGALRESPPKKIKIYPRSNKKPELTSLSQCRSGKGRTFCLPFIRLRHFKPVVNDECQKALRTLDARIDGIVDFVLATEKPASHLDHPPVENEKFLPYKYKRLATEALVASQKFMQISLSQTRRAWRLCALGGGRLR